MYRFTVSELDNEFNVDDLKFRVQVSPDGREYTIYLDGGYGLDDDGDWRETDDYEVASGELDHELDRYDEEFVIELTDQQIVEARDFRRFCPDELPDVVATTAEIAMQFCVTPMAVRKAIRESRLAARKSGGVWLIKWTDAARIQWRKYRRVN
jgi:hypothetical protein